MRKTAGKEKGGFECQSGKEVEIRSTIWHVKWIWRHVAFIACIAENLEVSGGYCTRLVNYNIVLKNVIKDWWNKT